MKIDKNILLLLLGSAQETFLIISVKMLLQVFMETMIHFFFFFFFLRMNRKLLEQKRTPIILNLFFLLHDDDNNNNNNKITVTCDQFNASLLNNSVLFEKCLVFSLYIFNSFVCFIAARQLCGKDGNHFFPFKALVPCLSFFFLSVLFLRRCDKLNIVQLLKTYVDTLRSVTLQTV